LRDEVEPNPMRILVALLVFLITAGAAMAQAAKKVYRIGYLTPFQLPSPGSEAFRQGMRDLGYVEGHDIVIEMRGAGQQYGELQKLATELVALKVDVIVAATGVTALAAKRATSSVPIVAAASNDAVAMGMVESLGRPGGNVTGLSGMSAELAPKRLELLKQLVPDLKRVLALWCPRSPISHEEMAHVKAAAKLLGVQVESLESDAAPQSWRTVLEAGLRQHRPGALFLLDCTNLPFQAIAETALQHRLPVMSPYLNVTRQGALVSYGPDWNDMHRRIAPTYVDKILKGANPADLPVQQPTTFDLALNTTTAKAIQLKIPRGFMLRVNSVIE
jgi:putative tryptophan/tyrosine transport system substrate-binding protein